MSSGKLGKLLLPYKVPEWAASVFKDHAFTPKFKLSLAMLNTPISQWELPGLPDDVTVHIKRDDMTGGPLSGNKVRKLEFLLADAVQKGCRHIITCGGLQSNHCRATTIAATQLGLKTHLFLRTDIDDVNNIENNGNVFLNKLCGADIYITPRKSPYVTHLKPRMEKLAEHILQSRNEKSYLICVGGSDTVGLHGYLNGFDELLSQGIQERFTDIVFACGSGGTAEGLAIGNALTNSQLRIHGIAVCDDRAYFIQHLKDALSELQLNDLNPSDMLQIIEGHKGRGYGVSAQEELDFILDVSSKTGIFLDPVYSGKAAKGLVHELNNNPDRFQGNKILFIHTGGIFGLFDGTINGALENSYSEDSSTKSHKGKMYMWRNLEDAPFS